MLEGLYILLHVDAEAQLLRLLKFLGLSVNDMMLQSSH